MAGTDQAPCVCGHARVAHEHYRRGTDCALCAPGDCPRYRTADQRRGWWRRIRGAARRDGGGAARWLQPQPAC